MLRDIGIPVGSEHQGDDYQVDIFALTKTSKAWLVPVKVGTEGMKLAKDAHGRHQLHQGYLCYQSPEVRNVRRW